MNLVPFALFSQKIPASFLAPQKNKSFTLRNLSSLFIDYLVVSAFTLTVTTMMISFLNIYLATLSSKFIIIYPQMMGLLVLPIALLLYYSICLYACDGSSLGTKITKQRISADTPLKTAGQLTLTIMTFGTTYFLIKGLFKRPDYRYENLMMIRDERVDLHALVKDNEHEDQSEWKIAA